MERDHHVILDETEPHLLTFEHEHARHRGPSIKVSGMRAFSAIAATLLVVALAGAIFGLLGGSRKSPHGASSTPTPSGCVPSKVSASFPAHFLASDLAMVSPDEGWLIGPINGQTRNAVILHYAHCAWQQVPGIISGFDLDSIVMVSPSDGWISGMDGSGTQSIVLHLVGDTWVRLPTLGNPAADTAQGRFAMLRCRGTDISPAPSITTPPAGGR